MSASKRDELVQNAMRAFYHGGFHAVGMDRLAKETGVSKTAIYKHFRTKEDLILAVLRLRDEQYRNWLVRRVEALAKTPTEQILAVFDALGEWFGETSFRSCIFVKASAEFQDRNDPIHATAAEHKRLLLNIFRKLTEKLDIEMAEELARELQLIHEGAIVLAHLQDPSQVAADAKRAAKRLLASAPTKDSDHSIP